MLYLSFRVSSHHKHKCPYIQGSCVKSCSDYFYNVCLTFKQIVKTENLNLILFSAKSACMCRICAKLFMNKRVLQEHERQHEKQAPYICCNKPFFSKANYMRHMCSKHGEEKKYRCSKCDATFSIKADLNRHVRNKMKNYHFKCSVCFAKFESKRKLLDHTGKHLPEKEKRHRCSVCQKTFRFETGLSRHKKKHFDFKW